MNRKIKIPWIFKCILTIVYAYLIYIVSSKDTSSISLPPYTDKLIHFVEFGLLCLMTCWTLSSDRIGAKKIYKIIIAIGITSLYGVSDEIHQSFTPHRSVAFFDWLADTVGAITAGSLWQRLAYKRQLKEKSLITGENPYTIIK
ncbi:MAG TPA: VanZ family protein [Candidatus Brocadiaceae bacterium]